MNLLRHSQAQPYSNSLANDMWDAHSTNSGLLVLDDEYYDLRGHGTFILTSNFTKSYIKL